jgi:hypothetical protein
VVGQKRNREGRVRVRKRERLFRGEDGSTAAGPGTAALEEAHVKYACVFPAFMFSYIGTIIMSLYAEVAKQTRI